MPHDAALLHDRYELVRALSRNRTSSTWEGLDTASGARCVVKELSVGAVVREGSTEASYDGDFTKLIDLFEREARVLANLDHPAIPHFIDHFREQIDDDMRLYTVQEFVAGQTLQELVEGGRHFTEEEAVRICRDLAEILRYLHDRSPPLIHRDVKPSNVIVGTDGEIHLVDFGSVRNLLDPEPLDGKTIVGTYGYMPIEQYEARAVPQSDFYALGMTLVYALSHRDPTEIPRTGLSLDFRPYVNVSGRFGRLLGWMIAPAPEDRPPDAYAILQALRSDGRQIPGLYESRQPADRAAVGYESRVRSSMAVAAGLLALLLGAIGFLGVGIPFREEPERRPPPGDVRRVAPLAGEGARQEVGPREDVVVAREGVLAIDLTRDFVYVAEGWPMGRASNQTTLPPLDLVAPPSVRGPDAPSNADVRFGHLLLGNGPDPRIDFALLLRPGPPLLFIDRNNNEDLSDDGPPESNEGNGFMASSASVDVVVTSSEGELVRPYHMWIWFTERADGPTYARMYARHHYAGAVELGGEVFEASIFEARGHDALYRDAGVCIDIDRDGECTEDSELFLDGRAIVTPDGPVTLTLLHR